MDGLKDLYIGLLALAEEQQKALIANDLERFFELQAAREIHFDNLKACSQAANDLPDAEKAFLRQVVERILKIDRDLEGDLTHRQDSARGEIGKLHTGIQALNAYVQEGYTGAYFIDRAR